MVRLARPGNLGLTYDVFMFCITKVSDAIPDRVRKIVLSMRKIVSIPRQSRGLYEGSLARPQYVGRLKAARGYPTRPGFGLRRSSEYNFVPDTWERMPHSILLIHLRALRSPVVVHRWGSVRVLGGSRSKFRRWAPGARLQEMSNFCCLPGRAGDLLC